MRIRHHSSSSSSDDEHRSERVHDRVRYVRRRPSPKRSNSYERRRPEKHHRDSSRRRRRPTTPPSDSDDDTVYKVDRYGRRYRGSSRERSKNRDRHAGRLARAYVLGALRPDPESNPDRQSSIADAKLVTEESPGLWSTIAGPFRINFSHPERSHEEEHEHCRCRRCHRGRPGSRHDRHHKRSNRSSRSKSSSSRDGTPMPRSPRPRGILRRDSSNDGSRLRLRKSVSFDSGTKIPYDFEESIRESSRDREERSPSPERAHEHPDRHESPEQRPTVSAEVFQEWYTQQAKVAAGDVAPELPTEIESPDSDAPHNCPRSHSPNDSRCRKCHHCPPYERSKKRGRKRPRMQTRRSEAAPLSQDEEQLRSVAHSILLSTHQSWCGGRCSDLSKFVQQKGGCSACCQRSHKVRRTGVGRSTPHCRTLIHCHKLGHGIFPAQRMILPAPPMIDRALRLAYADVYCCSIGEYVTPEEYLAYRRGGVGNLDIGIWIRGGSVREPTGLAEEVEKTIMLWSKIMSRARQSGQPCREEAVLHVLEDMARM